MADKNGDSTSWAIGAVFEKVLIVDIEFRR